MHKKISDEPGSSTEALKMVLTIVFIVVWFFFATPKLILLGQAAIQMLQKY